MSYSHFPFFTFYCIITPSYGIVIKNWRVKKVVKKTSVIILVLSLCVSLCFTMMPQASYAADEGGTVVAKKAQKKAGMYSVTMIQENVNYLPVTVTLPKLLALKQNKITKVKVTLQMKNGKKVMKARSKVIQISDIDEMTKSFNINAPAYGRYSVIVKYYKKSKLKKKVKIAKLGVIAEEYNIAVLNGTFGPLYFSMSLLGAEDSSNPGVKVNTTTTDGDPIPTIISLSRYYMYNWKAVPENTMSNPLMKSYKSGSFTKGKINGMAKYAKMLKSLNSNSKFHFYFTDNCIFALDKIVYMNKFKDSQFDAVLLTDGTESPYDFNEVYNNNSAKSTYKSMVDEFTTMITMHRKGKGFSYKSLDKYRKNLGARALSFYTYAATSRDNVSWWVSRKNGTFLCPDDDFLTAAKGQMIEMGLNRMLVDLGNKGTAENLKELFRLDQDMFADAEKNNKIPLVIMGTRVDLEEDFEPFEAYIVKAYSEDYEIYYKGHPASPTKLHPEKQKQLDKYGIHDVESSIPAELILFYYEDLMVAGESKSTLNQSYKDGHCKAYKGARLESVPMPDEQYFLHRFESYFTKVTSSYEDNIKTLCRTDGTCFLIEFSKTVQDVPYDIAIYDYTKKTIKYYKLDEETGQYFEVDQNGNSLAPAQPDNIVQQDNPEAPGNTVEEDNSIYVVPDEPIIDDAA